MPQSVVYAGTHSEGGPGGWMTPPWVLEIAREVMGSIGLDPMSSRAAQQHVRASRYWTKDDDCFRQPTWAAETLWLNPPFGRQILDKSVNRFIKEWRACRISKAMVITNNVTETKTGQALLSCAHSVWFPAGRIQFVDEATGELVKGNPRGQMVCSFGCTIPKTLVSGIVLRKW